MRQGLLKWAGHDDFENIAFGERCIIYYDTVHVVLEKAELLFGKKESHMCEVQADRQFAELGEEIESIICRLHELKDRVAQLRRKCEEFRNTVLEIKLEQTRNTRCNRCGHVLDPDQGVVVKGSDGLARVCYHIKCFQALLSTICA